MIPEFISISGSPWSVLPPGQHITDLSEVKTRYAINHRRRDLYEGLVLGALSLRSAGCKKIYLDGSFVTAKPFPNDFDVCWDTANVDPSKLEPVFKIFDNGRSAQKAMFLGEFFPSSITEGSSNLTFVDFFQVDRFTGGAKGILTIPIVNDPILLRRST